MAETLRDPNIKFPGESSEYRRARNQLLAAEDELRRLNERVAAQRRALPAGGLVGEDYIFESAADGSEVRFSELFAPGKDTLVIYHMMFPRWSKDPRAGAAGGKTALLPLVEQPCPSCTSLVDGSTALPPTSLTGSTWSWSRRQTPPVGHLRAGTRLVQFAAGLLAEQHLQPRLSRGNAGGRAAASLVGAAHQLKEHAQPHRLCGTTHSRRDLDNAECIRRLSVPVGWRNKIGASALAKPDSFDLGGRVPADTADMATGEDRPRAGQADVPVLGRMIDCPQGVGHPINLRAQRSQVNTGAPGTARRDRRCAAVLATAAVGIPSGR